MARGGRSAGRRSTRSGSGRRPARKGSNATGGRSPRDVRRDAPSGVAGEESFPAALAALLRSRRIRVPRGLVDAPRHAYASQPPSFVQQLAKLGDDELRLYAEKIAGYVRKQEERARKDWESSPLIAELRRRRLPEPACPARAVGASVSLAKPLGEWSDAEIIRAADEWSRMGQP